MAAPPSTATAATNGAGLDNLKDVNAALAAGATKESPALPPLAPSETNDPNFGHKGHLTESQQQALNAFKALLHGKGLLNQPQADDVTLLRFLRARRWEPQAALKQYAEYMAWRAEKSVDKFYVTHDIDSYNEARKVYPSWTGRRTRRGLPVYIYRVADLDKKAISQSLSQGDKSKSKILSKSGSKKAEDYPASIVALYESMMQNITPLLSRLRDRPDPDTPISTSVNIVDITGVGLKQFFSLRGHLGDASELATQRYPETLDKILVVGAPPYIQTVFDFIAKWFDANTRRKIEIVPFDKAANLAKLQEFIATEDIPQAYGGTLEWSFGDMPNLDPEVVRVFGMPPNTKTLPIGPLRLEGDDLVALGTNADGSTRRELVGRYRSDAYSIE